MPKPLPLTQHAHQIIRAHLTPEDYAIDATCGNGHDTIFLARHAAHVFAFDIQKQAIENTRKRVHDEGFANKVTLYHSGHQYLVETVPSQFYQRIKVVTFNLGYLPGSDKHIITQAESTLKALDASLQLLASDGLITLLIYPGHSGGDTEYRSIQHWLSQSSEQLKIDIIESARIRPGSPLLYVLQKTSFNNALDRP